MSHPPNKDVLNFFTLRQSEQTVKMEKQAFKRGMTVNEFLAHKEARYNFKKHHQHHHHGHLKQGGHLGNKTHDHQGSGTSSSSSSSSESD